MTRSRLLAKAVAWNASRDPKHLANLTQAQIETVLSMSSFLRDGRSSAWILAAYARPTENHALGPVQADRLKRMFEVDQAGPPQVLP